MIKVQNVGKGNGSLFTHKCPECGQGGTSQRISDIPDLHVTEHWLGHRECPTPSCKAHVFFVAADSFSPQRTYPPVRIPLDATNVPERIKKALLEAVSCDAEECHVAAAIMVRRTLEELCEDRNATGKNLKERIQSLR